jgi:putative NADH-flavin reductase
MNKIAVFGVSGRTGKLFTELVLKNGYEVKALVREPSKLGLQHPNLQVLQGDVSNPIQVEEAINATEAVIDLVGPSKGSPPDLQRTATRHIIQVMKQNDVKRLIVLASLPFGILDENDKPAFMSRFMMFVAKNLMGAMVEDAREHIDLIKQSDLDWTVVRAPGLNDQPPHGIYLVGSVDANTGNSISRADVAAFMLDELKNPKYVRKMPLISI